jgi:hypothetical protein
MVVNIEALLRLLQVDAVEEKLRPINNHLNQLIEVHPIKLMNILNLQKAPLTLFDDVGETIVVPFCKWPVCSLSIVVVDAFVRVAV